MSQLLRHFGLSHHPFTRRTPKDALYRHRGFEEASRRLLFTLELDSMAAVIAVPGCDKSLLLGDLHDSLMQDGWCVYYFAHATTGPYGMINVLARMVGLSPRCSRPETAAAITNRLIEGCEDALRRHGVDAVGTRRCQWAGRPIQRRSHSGEATTRTISPPEGTANHR